MQEIAAFRFRFFAQAGRKAEISDSRASAKSKCQNVKEGGAGQNGPDGGELEAAYTNKGSGIREERRSLCSSLDYQDSNLDKQNQNLLCYHYTIVQTSGAFC